MTSIAYSLLRLVTPAAITWLALSAAPVQAQGNGLKPQALFAEFGFAERRTVQATAGLVWPGAWRWSGLGGELSGSMELFASHWSVLGFNGREAYTLVGVTPLLRYRFDEGRSPWFAEGGVGLSVLDSQFRTPNKHMSTRFNFYDVLAVGRSFGADRRHELSLRLNHISNADIKTPNPGQEFVQLRYLARF